MKADRSLANNTVLELSVVELSDAFISHVQHGSVRDPDDDNFGGRESWGVEISTNLADDDADRVDATSAG